MAAVSVKRSISLLALPYGYEDKINVTWKWLVFTGCLSQSVFSKFYIRLCKYMNLLKVTLELWFFIHLSVQLLYWKYFLSTHGIFFLYFFFNPNYFHPLFIQIYLTHEITYICTAEEGDVFSVWETAIKELKIFFKIF